MSISPSVPGTDERVPRHTSPNVNKHLRQVTLANLNRFSGASGSEIDQRIAELSREWDIERTLEANAATVALIGLGLGTFVNRKWLALPAIVGGFLLQHAIQGWCPPLPVFRRLGIRSAAEIHEEITALKTLRGDFGPPPDAATALARASLS